MPNPTLVEMEAPDTQRLLDRARGGDPDAFCELCRTVETRLLRQAISLCGNASLAEDLAQETLVEAWRYLHRYNGRCQLFTWLCAILLNRHRQRARKRWLLFLPATPQPANEDADWTERLADGAAQPDEAVELYEQAALVRSCIEALPGKHQQVIYLRFFADDSLEGIAAALGCSVGTVKSRLFHALDKLRRMRAFNVQAAERRMKGGTL